MKKPGTRARPRSSSRASLVSSRPLYTPAALAFAIGARGAGSTLGWSSLGYRPDLLAPYTLAIMRPSRKDSPAARFWGVAFFIVVPVARVVRCCDWPGFGNELRGRSLLTVSISMPPCSRRSRTSPPSGPEPGPSLTAAVRDGPHQGAGRDGRMAPPGAEQKNDANRRGKCRRTRYQTLNRPRNRGKSN